MLTVNTKKENLPTVAIILLNWNNAADTLECLASIRSLDYPNFSVVVVDNGSTDDSITKIREQFPTVTVIENGANLGFAAGNNRGIEYARKMGFEWIFLLNPDTIIASNALSEMLQVAESDPTIGILGPTIYHADEPTIIQSAGGMLDHRWWISTIRGQNQSDQGQYREPVDVDWVAGCAMLVNVKTIEQIGNLDERFFMYEEELDWCLRARRAGWRIVHVPQAKVWHKGVQRHYRPKPYVTYYMTRNHFLLLAKHRAPASAWVWTWLQTLRTLLSWTVKPKWRMMREHRNAMWLGVLDFLRQRWGKCPL